MHVLVVVQTSLSRFDILVHGPNYHLKVLKLQPQSYILYIIWLQASYYQNTDRTVQTQHSWLHGFSGCILMI